MYSGIELRQIVHEEFPFAFSELGDAPFKNYLRYFKGLDRFNKEELEIAVAKYFNDYVDIGKINQPKYKTPLLTELKQFIEENADLVEEDIQELFKRCPKHLKSDLLSTLRTAEIDVEVTRNVIY